MTIEGREAYPYESHDFMNIKKYLNKLLHLLHRLEELPDSCEVSQLLLRANSFLDLLNGELDIFETAERELLPLFL